MKTINTTVGICTGRNGTTDIKAIEVTYRPYQGNDEIRIDCISKARGIALNAGFSMDMPCAKELAYELLALCGIQKLPIKIVDISVHRKVCTTENGTEKDEIEIWAEAKVLLAFNPFVQTIRSAGIVLQRSIATEKERKREDKMELKSLLKLLLVMGFSKEDLDLKKGVEIDIDLDKLILDMKQSNLLR